MAHHRIEAGPETVHWGYFDAALRPLLTIDSGETVTISTVSGAPEVMPPPPLVVPPALAAVHATHKPKLPGHICTGPIAIRGAKAGQVLEVRIKDIGLHYDWGYNYSAPLKGALPDDFAETHLIHITLDRERMTGRLPWGLELPLKRRRDGGRAAGALGVGLDPAAAPQRRQSRQQGARRRNDALPPDPRRRGAVLGRRRARRAGRRRGLRHRDRDRARRHLRADRARRHGPRLADGRDPDPRHDDGLRPGPRHLRHDRAQGHARPDRGAHRPHAPGGLRAVQPRRRPAGDAGRQRREGHPRDAGEALPGRARLVLLRREATGEGDRRRRWRGRGQRAAPGIAPSTMLRMVPLPRFAGEEPRPVAARTASLRRRGCRPRGPTGKALTPARGGRSGLRSIPRGADGAACRRSGSRR